jgi:signal transduction histidine kinase
MELPAVLSQTEARILLVDDDRVLLWVLADVLARGIEGAFVETCSSPVEALGNIATNDYDVVVSDLLMVGLDGLELLERIRAMRPDTLVVLITGAADHDLSIRALRGGAYDFIQKPVDPDYLVASVRRAIETRRLRAKVERQQATLRRHADQLEQIVAQRTEQLRSVSRAKDEFLATMSHELRTPLTAILGWARLLHGGGLDATEQEQAIETIARNARSQAQLIDDLLDVSRAITGKLRLDVREVDLAAVLENALRVVLPAAKARGVEVEAAVDASIEPISGDPDRLQQVLWNLLSNAVKFTPAGGRVNVVLSRKGELIEIEVKDNGAGIDPAFLPFVFERFRQGVSGISSRRGLGLGLAITRHLVELHGGTVSAESAGSGAGATFTVVLPCRAEERAPSGGKWPKVTPAGRPMLEPPGQCLLGVRVLVVDDEVDTQKVLRFVLERAGAEVVVASSVSEAREAFRRARPDVLLCDIGLGEEEGTTLMRELRALPSDEGGRVRAIAFTGYARSVDREQVLAAGFELHLPKPGPPNLAAIVAGLLEDGAEHA